MRVDCFHVHHWGKTVAPIDALNTENVKAFYSDTFVLPLPEQHRFPMAKYRLLRERLVAEAILDAGDLHVPDAVGWDDLRLVHERA